MSVTANSIDLEWTAATDNVGVVSYQIFQSTDNVSFTEIHESDGVTLAYTAIGLTPETQYYFKQTAKDAADNQSIYGNTVTATTLAGSAYTYLLDDYPGAAAAYSLRKLRTGETLACNIRRDTGELAGVELYDDHSKSIDLNSMTSTGLDLATWVDGQSAYVVTWYDQSGNNNDAVQTTTTKQPRLINAGVLEAKGIFYDGLDDGLSAPDSASLKITGDMSAYAVFNISSLPDISTIFIKRLANSVREYEFRVEPTETGYLDGFNNISYLNTNSINADYLQSFDRVGDTSVQVYKNTANSGLQPLSGTNVSSSKNLEIGARVEQAVFYFNGGIKEIILWSSDQSANRTAIEDSINATYNIWVVTAEVDAQLIQADNDNVSDTVIEINGVRSSASDTAVANLISRNNTVITN